MPFCLDFSIFNIESGGSDGGRKKAKSNLFEERVFKMLHCAQSHYILENYIIQMTIMVSPLEVANVYENCFSWVQHTFLHIFVYIPACQPTTKLRPIGLRRCFGIFIVVALMFHLKTTPASLPPSHIKNEFMRVFL